MRSEVMLSKYYICRINDNHNYLRLNQSEANLDPFSLFPPPLSGHELSVQIYDLLNSNGYIVYWA